MARLLPLLLSNWAVRSNGVNGRSWPSRMRRVRGIQPVCSAWIRWPMTSYGDQVSPPSVARIHVSGRPSRRAEREAGVRSRTAKASARRVSARVMAGILFPAAGQQLRKKPFRDWPAAALLHMFYVPLEACLAVRARRHPVRPVPLAVELALFAVPVPVPRGHLGGRSVPHFQHASNWPSISSPQARHFQE